MSSSKFQPATRKKLRLRMALDGPAGSGKSVTALRFAMALARHGNGRIAVIDSESGSARLYVGQDYGEGPINFEVVELKSFAPTEYTAAIEDAGRAGFDVCVVDSLSHAWEGKDGALELVDKSASKSKYTAWKDVTPMHRRMVDAILTSPCHVIATMRSKTEYVLQTNDKGQQVPQKIGMAPIQRAGMEYEFTIYGSMDFSHIMTITKSRCSAVDGAIIVKPGEPFMLPLIEWLETGQTTAIATPPSRIANATLESIMVMFAELNRNLDTAKRQLVKQYSVTEFGQLTAEQGEEMARRLKAEVEKKRAGRRGATSAEAAANTNGTPSTNGDGNGNGNGDANGNHNGKGDESHLRKPMDPADRITAEQAAGLAEIKATFERDHGLTRDRWLEILGRYNVTTGRDLTQSQATELTTKLKQRLLSLEMEAGLTAGAKS